MDTNIFITLLNGTVASYMHHQDGVYIRIACDAAYIIQVDVKLIIAIVHSCKLKL